MVRDSSDRPSPPAVEQCGRCGALVAPSSRFCPVCGAPTRSACPNCGTSIVPDAPWCPTCGHRLDRAGSPNARQAGPASRSGRGRGIWILVGAVLSFAVVVGAAAWLYLSAPERQQEKPIATLTGS